VNLRFNVNYYIFALLFLLFDVEAALLFPWAVAYDKLGWLGFFEAVVFIGILAMGLVYAWRRGVLKWVY
jgi:NADH:ubiquinone oxidoreductase subunit 3 (subunit A)